jgi:hypothetical protein
LRIRADFDGHLAARENGAEYASKGDLKDDKKPVEEVGCEPEG